MLVKTLPMKLDQFIIIIKKKKGIFGTASVNEIKELKDEGIEAEINTLGGR